MKKFFLFLATCAMSIATFAAASITASDVDFGTVSIKGESLPITGSQTVTVSFSGLATEGYSMYATVSEGLLDDETNPNGFYVTPSTQQLGYGVGSGTLDFELYYSVKAAGTYTGKLKFSCYDTNYEEVIGYNNITITVTGDAVVAQVVPFERVEKTADLADGDTIVFVCESENAVCGPLEGTALSSITENVKLTNGQAKFH